ncbi:MAG TPA: PEGA domain-containing protein [Polyangiaceae bacterium]|jgi:hypothetical protein|nr:PEGA domain-containing protein [Polyangiaceae bacterium]
MMRTLSLPLAALVLATVSLASKGAFAEEDPAPTPTPTPSHGGEAPEARLYFNAGARAYAAGKYGAAVRAFEEAYRIEPRPGLVFSIAQAYRRQYFIDKAKENLTEAIRHYRKYLEVDPDGARRGDTGEALSELEPIASKLTPAEAAAVAPQAASKPASQLMISSPVDDVAISLDGKTAGTLPYFAAVSPGVHRVTLTASGYLDYQRDVRVLDGSVVPLDVALEEKPAKLAVTAPDGARISVDGRFRGVSPSAPLELSPGRHFVTVTRNGHEAYSRELDVGRDEKRTLHPVMPDTGQRTVAWLLIGTGGTAFLAGGGLMIGALLREGSAKDERSSVTTPGDIATYNDTVTSRNELRTAGIIAASSGLVVTGVGLFLYAFDEPRSGERMSDERPPERHRAPSRESSPGLDVSAAPWFSPGSAGASVRGVF